MTRNLLSLTLTLSTFVISMGQQIEYYEGKMSLGNPSVGWYKIASFDLAGNGNYNSVVVDAQINYTKTSELGYLANARLFIREGTSQQGKWLYDISGTQTGDFLKYKRINDTTYELFAYSTGNYAHLSIRLAVTREAALYITIPSTPTTITDPDIYTSVPLVGKTTFIADKIGIGTTQPDSKLTVNGNIHAEEVKVDLSIPGPDYVFKEGYDLKSLEEVQNYIKVHGHLPNIPSAQEMEENGIQLGEMNMKLLEKIEELTMYLMKENQTNKKQQEIIEQQWTLITELQNIVKKNN